MNTSDTNSIKTISKSSSELDIPELDEAFWENAYLSISESSLLSDRLFEMELFSSASHREDYIYFAQNNCNSKWLEIVNRSNDNNNK